MLPTNLTSEPVRAPRAAGAGDWDVVVVGGGINGAGIARDLAGRGLAVLLVEQDDLASHTSSASTKLVHGGLRYLEHYEFALVRKALAEREVLLRAAPHLIWPLEFVMPHAPSMRPSWMIRAGLLLYDHLARRRWLPASRVLDLRRHEAGRPLRPRYVRGYAYADAWADDARLVVANAMAAAADGARVLTRTRCVQVRRDGDGWRVRLEPSAGGAGRELRARALVNAAGPWAARFLAEAAGAPEGRGLRLIKGSHIVVRRRFDHPLAYILQCPDRRIVFAIPYEGAFTLIGTTDVEYRGPIGQASIQDDEVRYLCDRVNDYLEQPVSPADVVWSFAGVRPLLEGDSSDPSALTRDYALELDADKGAPLLKVWGGKLTTYRRLAEEAADMLAPRLGARRGAWTAGVPLPGGDLAGWLGRPPGRPDEDFEDFVRALARQHPEASPAVVRRLARAYGTAAVELLAQPLGGPVAPGVHEAELEHLRAREWALDGDDVLWRRSKLGLHLAPADAQAVRRWMASRARPAQVPDTLPG